MDILSPRNYYFISITNVITSTATLHRIQFQANAIGKSSPRPYWTEVCHIIFYGARVQLVVRIEWMLSSSCKYALFLFFSFRFHFGYNDFSELFVSGMISNENTAGGKMERRRKRGNLIWQMTCTRITNSWFKYQKTSCSLQVMRWKRICCDAVANVTKTKNGAWDNFQSKHVSHLLRISASGAQYNMPMRFNLPTTLSASIYNVFSRLSLIFFSFFSLLTLACHR